MGNVTPRHVAEVNSALTFLRVFPRRHAGTPLHTVSTLSIMGARQTWSPGAKTILSPVLASHGVNALPTRHIGARLNRLRSILHKHLWQPCGRSRLCSIQRKYVFQSELQHRRILWHSFCPGTNRRASLAAAPEYRSTQRLRRQSSDGRRSTEPILRARNARLAIAS